MKSFIDSIRNLVQPEQPLVPSSPTGTHSPDAFQAARLPPVAVDPSVDHPEPISSQFQTPLEWIPVPIPESDSRELVLFSRPPLPVPPRGSDESTSSDSIQGSATASDGGDSKTTSSVSPPLQWYDKFKNQNMLCEEAFVLADLHAGVRQFIVHAGFQRTLTDVEPLDADVVREFWAHLPSVKSEDVSVRVWLRGMSMSSLQICGTNWSPTMNPFYKNWTRLMLLYRLGNGIPFNFGKLVVDHVMSVARSSVAKLYLPFPSLIYRLLAAQRPVECLLKGVSPHPSSAGVVEPTDMPDQATSSSGPSSIKLQRAIRQAIQILQAALTGGDEVEKEEESRAKNKGKRKAA
ncbi:hypothetical protein AALP_AA6G295700 [Arabis alpina]|uniref:Putative plant transposon protein domain-containing protein n=1 Tax=Arabis alpina TaxID=50452 RepID=A0A087GSK3_ARAAL|nr:hypothetical protein AALP_AA6G295700 [Arabis alpina]